MNLKKAIAYLQLLFRRGAEGGLVQPKVNVTTPTK